MSAEGTVDQEQSLVKRIRIHKDRELPCTGRGSHDSSN